MIKFILRTIGDGIMPLVVIGVGLWAFKSFFAQMDIGVQELVSFIPSVDLHYTGVGLVFLFVIAFLFGLIKRIKIFNKSLSLGTLVGLFIRGKLLRVLNSPIIEVETIPGVRFDRGWLVDIVREKIRKKDGTTEELISYYCFLPTANNPTSGQIPRIDVKYIRYILERPSSRLFRNVFSFGTSGNNWNRIEFNPDDYPPHNPIMEEDEE